MDYDYNLADEQKVSTDWTKADSNPVEDILKWMDCLLYTSMVETGRRSIPKKWEEEIEKIYSLNLKQKEELISILNRDEEK